MIDYNECIDHIEKKYKIKTRGYKHKDFKGIYFDFWHSLLGLYGDEISNPCEIEVNLNDLVNKADALTGKTLLNIASMQIKLEKLDHEHCSYLSEQVAELAIRSRADWRERIVSLIRAEYSEHIKNDLITFRISW